MTDFTGEVTCTCGRKMKGGGGSVSPKLSYTSRSCECGIKAIFYSTDKNSELVFRAQHKEEQQLAEVEKEKLMSILTLSGLKPKRHWDIKNGYHGQGADWILADTPIGLIKFGWRKRVIEIDWSDTKVNYLVEDEVTKDNNFCHAWSYPDAVKYMFGLKKAYEEQHGTEINCSEQESLA